MDQLRYYFAACLILINTPASAAVADALTQAGFTCLAATDRSGAPFGGTICTHEAMSTSAFSLHEAVAVYVPSATSVVVRHIVLYLQGFRGVCGDTGTTPADVMNVFDLAEQMQADSLPDSVLVFPMSGGHDTTYYHDFATTTGPFAEFMNWIETIVGQGQWSLAGHSGAGDVIAKLLNLNPSTIAKFDAIELLDAAYRIRHVASRFGSKLALWQTIAERNPSLTLTCIGNGTYSGCQILAEQAGFTTVVVTETQVIHCEIPNTYFGPWLHRTGPAAEESRIWDWFLITRGTNFFYEHLALALRVSHAVRSPSEEPFLQ